MPVKKTVPKKRGGLKKKPQQKSPLKKSLKKTKRTIKKKQKTKQRKMPSLPPPMY